MIPGFVRSGIPCLWTAICQTIFKDLNRNIILNGIHNLEAICARKSCILSSGYYLKDVAIIETAMSKFGLENAETFMRGNWCANRFVRA